MLKLFSKQSPITEHTKAFTLFMLLEALRTCFLYTKMGMLFFLYKQCSYMDHMITVQDHMTTQQDHIMG